MDYTKLIADLHQADELTADHRILALTDRAASALEELTKPKQTDYTELVKALRCKRDDCEGCDLSFFDKDEGWMCQYAAKDDDAADAIEALQSEIRQSMQRCAECGDELAQQLPKLGEWQKAKPKGVVTYSDGYAECSHCHETIWLGWGMNFCPHCGTQNRIIDPGDYDWAKMEAPE